MSPIAVLQAVRAVTGIALTVERELKRSEGFRSQPYRDHLGNLTIGYGTLLEGKGLSKEEAAVILLMRAGGKKGALVKALANRGINFAALPEPARQTLERMAYQMGVSGVMRFKRMIAAIRDGRWKTAHAEALDSKWAREQTARRARRVVAGFLEAATWKATA